MSDFTTYTVTMTLKLREGYHPRKWVPDAICDVLELGEELVDYEIEEIESTTDTI